MEMHGNDDSHEVEGMETSILKNLNEELDPDEMPSDEEEENYDDPEMLMELEKRQEELLEEFLELAYTKKHETIEELKVDIKSQKMDKAEERKLT